MKKIQNGSSSFSSFPINTNNQQPNKMGTLKRNSWNAETAVNIAPPSIKSSASEELVVPRLQLETVVDPPASNKPSVTLALPVIPTPVISTYPIKSQVAGQVWDAEEEALIFHTIDNTI
jgi:hypothetical protein